MNTLPIIATVTDLQRRYRPLVDEVKKTGEPIVIVNHGEPDIVILDPVVYNAQVSRLRELEEAYLLVTRDEALKEHKQGKTIKLGKNQKLSGSGAIHTIPGSKHTPLPGNSKASAHSPFPTASG